MIIFLIVVNYFLCGVIARLLHFALEEFDNEITIRNLLTFSLIGPLGLIVMLLEIGYRFSALVFHWFESNGTIHKFLNFSILKKKS